MSLPRKSSVLSELLRFIVTTVAHLPATICLLAAFYGSAIGGTPTIESVWPAVGQRGTEFEVKIVGSGLTNCRQVVFYSPHLVSKSVKANSDYEVVVTVSADESCGLGYEPFRLLADDGFSELRTIRITPFPVELHEKSSRPADAPAPKRRGGTRGEVSGPAPAYKVFEPTRLTELNRTICGVLHAGEADRYVINLKAGQWISIEVDAIRLGNQLLDTVLSVFGPTGDLLASADDNSRFQQDPTLSFKAIVGGDYVIDLHESNYNGGELSHYALHIGEFPESSIAYPAGGMIGSKIEINLIGQSYEVLQQTVTLPSVAAEVRDFQLLPKRGDITGPSPVPFRLSPLANVLEAEPNNEPDAKQHTAAEFVAFNGILQTHGDVDHFSFEAEAGQTLRIEAFANRIGSAADTQIAILDSEMQVIAVNDDWGSHDSRIDFHPPQTGRYYLRVTDKLAAGAANAVYRVEVSPLKPNVTAFFPRPNRLSQQSQTIAVPQGNRVLARMGVRRELVDGDVRMEFIDLPSGVSASKLTIPADQYWMPVVLEAKDSAQLGGQMAGVDAFLNSSDQVVGNFEQIIDLVAESADQLFRSAHVTRIPVAVAPSIPFSIDLEPPKTSLSQSGTIDIVVTLRRQTTFKGPVRVELPFLPPWVVASPFIVIPADQDKAVYPLTARQEISARVWPLVATARVDTVSSTEDTSALDGREVASRIVQLGVRTSPVSGRFVNLAAEQGQTLQVQCELERLGELPQKLTATLEGLPNRVSADPVEVDESHAAIKFNVLFEADAPVGRFNSVQCRLSGEWNGQRVSFVVAPASTLQITERGKLFRNADGSVLSPLEALRQQRNATTKSTLRQTE